MCYIQWQETEAEYIFSFSRVLLAEPRQISARQGLCPSLSESQSFTVLQYENGEHQ
jgi:hypothetical protein